MTCTVASFLFFFFNDTATTEIYTLSLHDALPIYPHGRGEDVPRRDLHRVEEDEVAGLLPEDRKSTRLNSSHLVISYAVFCLKKKTEVEDLHLYVITLLHNRTPQVTCCRQYSAQLF